MPRSSVESRVTGFRIDSKTIRKRNIPSHACTGISDKKRLGERIRLMNRKGYTHHHCLYKSFNLCNVSVWCEFHFVKDGSIWATCNSGINMKDPANLWKNWEFLFQYSCMSKLPFPKFQQPVFNYLISWFHCVLLNKHL